MRIAMMVVGAVAVALTASPAAADRTVYLFFGSSEQILITGGYVEYCSSIIAPINCTRSGPVLVQPLPYALFTVPDLNGTYSFSGRDGLSSSSGTYGFSGSITFENGRLISDYADFGYGKSVVYNNTAYTASTQGRFINATGILFDQTGQGYQQIVPIPEPAIWTLMIAGFGMVGSAMRRQRRDGSTSRAPTAQV